MVLLKNLVLIFLLSIQLSADKIKYFLNEIDFESNQYTYESNNYCSIELNKINLTFKNAHEIDLQGSNVNHLCKAYYYDDKLKKLEIYETTTYNPNIGQLEKVKEIKLLKEFLFNNSEQVIFNQNFVSNEYVKYTNTKDLIFSYHYRNNFLQTIEIRYFKNNMLKNNVHLTEGILKKSNLLLSTKIILDTNKQLIQLTNFSYNRGVKSCTYDKNLHLISSNNTFREWILKKNNKGIEYPAIKTVNCKKRIDKNKEEVLKNMMDYNFLNSNTTTKTPSQTRL